MRSIEEILRRRSDFSPFLVHLTRSRGRRTAKDCLSRIIEERRLEAGISKFSVHGGALSEAKYAVSMKKSPRKKKLFGFISFTETPLHEIHCLLDVRGRKINLEPYGLVFLKDRLMRLGVSPAFYINNVCGDKDAVVGALVSLIGSYEEEASQILPLVSVFGHKLKPKGAATQGGKVDFLWEREWRCPFAKSPLDFTENDVWVGLCPDDEIKEFERLFPPVQFIDPRVLTRHDVKVKLKRACDRLTLNYHVPLT